jgi:hypothetical protein
MIPVKRGNSWTWGFQHFQGLQGFCHNFYLHFCAIKILTSRYVLYTPRNWRTLATGHGKWLIRLPRAVSRRRDPAGSPAVIATADSPRDKSSRQAMRMSLRTICCGAERAFVLDPIGIPGARAHAVSMRPRCCFAQLGRQAPTTEPCCSTLTRPSVSRFGSRSAILQLHFPESIAWLFSNDFPTRLA